MPSPFPGMDPYLEDPAVFPDLHDSFVVYLSAAVNALLPPPYYSGIASRTWLLRTPSYEEEIRETFLELYAQPGAEDVVASIEILSPLNKTPGDHGHDLYRKKQREALCSQVHLIEIDLLRRGTHTTAIPLALALECEGRFDYHVCTHQFDGQGDYIFYPIHLQQRLPVLPIPLLPGDPPVKVDLQAVLDRCYDTGNYRRRVRYRERQPVPPLRPEQAAWAEQLLRAKGILEPLPGTQEVKTENK
jgi:hypothetical protein